MFIWGILPLFFPILPLTSYLYPSSIFLIFFGVLRLSHSRSPYPIFSSILSLTPSPAPFFFLPFYVFLYFSCLSFSLTLFQFYLFYFIFPLICQSLSSPLSPFFLILSLCPFSYPFFSPFFLSLAFYIPLFFFGILHLSNSPPHCSILFSHSLCHSLSQSFSILFFVCFFIFRSLSFSLLLF
jgi:hypothetical protein